MRTFKALKRFSLVLIILGLALAVSGFSLPGAGIDHNRTPTTKPTYEHHTQVPPTAKPTHEHHTEVPPTAKPTHVRPTDDDDKTQMPTQPPAPTDVPPTNIPPTQPPAPTDEPTNISPTQPPAITATEKHEDTPTSQPPDPTATQIFEITPTGEAPTATTDPNYPTVPPTVGPGTPTITQLVCDNCGPNQPSKADPSVKGAEPVVMPNTGEDWDGILRGAMIIIGLVMAGIGIRLRF